LLYSFAVALLYSFALELYRYFPFLLAMSVMLSQLVFFCPALELCINVIVFTYPRISAIELLYSFALELYRYFPFLLAMSVMLSQLTFFFLHLNYV
jgi:hypothetical protein